MIDRIDRLPVEADLDKADLTALREEIEQLRSDVSSAFILNSPESFIARSRRRHDLLRLVEGLSKSPRYFPLLEGLVGLMHEHMQMKNDLDNQIDDS